MPPANTTLIPIAVNACRPERRQDPEQQRDEPAATMEARKAAMPRPKLPATCSLNKSRTAGNGRQKLGLVVKGVNWSSWVQQDLS